jgi:hypothetical protein
MTTTKRGHGPNHDARIKKVAGGLKTTTATDSDNAPDFIATCVDHAWAETTLGLWPDANKHDGEAPRLATLKTQFSKHGHNLHQSGPGDGPGPVSYLVERWGLVRHLPTLDDAERFLAEIGQASKYSGDQS